MRIAICDDELLFQENMKRHLDIYYNSLDIAIYKFSEGQQLIKKIEDDINFFQIIFLDIEMPGMNGLECAKAIHDISNSIHIIFLTSHIELAMEGYEVNAFRFLSKPVNEDKLKKALSDIEDLQKSNERILINNNGMEQFVSCKDVMYVQAENVYINIFTSQGSYLVRKKINDIENVLNKMSFFRVHRSYIINMDFVQSFEGKKIIMKDKKEIPVSRQRETEFKHRIMNYLRKCSD